MIDVVCVNFGNKYSHEYTLNLVKAVKKFLSYEHEFYCITDNPIPEVNCYVPPDIYFLKGWWNKLFIFRAEFTNPVLYLDLDQIIINSLNKFVELDKSKFWIINDFATRNNTICNSSVMFFDPSKYRYIFEDFSLKDLELFHNTGDQGYIQSKINPSYFPNSWIKSWKWEVYRGGILGHSPNTGLIYKNTTPDLSETSILCFHGKPDPSELEALLPFWRTEIDRPSEQTTTLSFNQY